MDREGNSVSNASKILNFSIPRRQWMINYWKHQREIVKCLLAAATHLGSALSILCRPAQRIKTQTSAWLLSQENNLVVQTLQK